MKIYVEVQGARFEVDTRDAVELAMALDFCGPQPGAYFLSPATARAVEAGGFVGDRRRGGSVNCETLELTPHGNGTHTEGVGHLTEERIAVADLAPEPLLAAALLTLVPRRLKETDEGYRGRHEDDDFVLCAKDLEAAGSAAQIGEGFFEALVVRLARGEAFCGGLKNHSGTNPPYFTEEAIRWMRERGCEHLLVEIPSVDREDDGGALPNHHDFFGLTTEQVASEESRARTITELISVPESIPDGPCVLSLRFPRFITDAVPSRPVLYPLISV